MSANTEDLDQDTEQPTGCGVGLSETMEGEICGTMEPDAGPEADPEPEPEVPWVPEGRRLISGLMGLNVVLLGAALVAAEAFNPQGIQHQEPQVFILLLMVLSVAWMMWYLLWAQRQPGMSPHKDHHAGGITITVALMIFSAFSLLLHIFRMGYLVMMWDCKPLGRFLAPFIEAPFLGLQTYLLWAHSKDCIHKHKVVTRSGLILILSADLLLWLNAVTEDTVHMELELERRGLGPNNTSLYDNDSEIVDDDPDSTTQCRCSERPPCAAFRKGLEVLYPFNMEFCLMAGCILYIMWKNVGRRVDAHHHGNQRQRLTLRVVHAGGILFGPLVGLMVLLMGVAAFVLYQVWVNSRHRYYAFLVFYIYHLVVMPAMALCSLVGIAAYRLERRAHEGSHNPTRSLDVLLLGGAALGQLILSYFSLVASLSLGPSDDLAILDLSYSLLSLLELVLQNIFIIDGLHRHPSLSRSKRKRKVLPSVIFKKKKEVELQPVGSPGANSLLEEGKQSTLSPGWGELHTKNTRTKRVIQETSAFLILANIMLWVIPAFGAHPQFENGLGKDFYGFQAWFVLVNLGQPLVVFYRMHSVGVLMELLLSA